VSIAKNYLSHLELSELNEIVTMYLDYASRQARRFIPMTMEDWKNKLDAFLNFNDTQLSDGISSDFDTLVSQSQNILNNK
jgi:hypothetical protein